MVTHDVWEALLLADRIVVMDKGKVLADARPPNCWPAIPTKGCGR
ncbi:MAG: hypothetical protein WDM85_03120 [Caulobacteraceae bacterium]